MYDDVARHHVQPMSPLRPRRCRPVHQDQVKDHPISLVIGMSGLAVVDLLFGPVLGQPCIGGHHQGKERKKERPSTDLLILHFLLTLSLTPPSRLFTPL